jgi:hypothetical protein
MPNPCKTSVNLSRIKKLHGRTYVPPSLSNIHEEGALSRFKCFLGPRAYKTNEFRLTMQIKFQEHVRESSGISPSHPLIKTISSPEQLPRHALEGQMDGKHGPYRIKLFLREAGTVVDEVYLFTNCVRKYCERD